MFHLVGGLESVPGPFFGQNMAFQNYVAATEEQTFEGKFVIATERKIPYQS